MGVLSPDYYAPGRPMSYGASVTFDLPQKKEDKVKEVFDDLNEVFGIGSDFENGADFFKALHYAAEGLRQHEALHRVEDAFSGGLTVLVGEWHPAETDAERAFNSDPDLVAKLRDVNANPEKRGQHERKRAEHPSNGNGGDAA